MSTDFQLFPGKSLSGLFEDIYNNQVNKKEQISKVIHEMRNGIRHAGDMAVVGPIIKDLIDTSVKNDEQLVKLATIAQRIIASESKSEGEDGFLSAEERKQLLEELDTIQEEVQSDEEIDDIKNQVEDATKE